MPDRDHSSSRRNYRFEAGRDSLLHPGTDGEDLLRAALAVARGSVEASRSKPWSPVEFRLSCDREIEQLRDWAVGEDLWVETENLGEYRRGRREHDLYRRSDLLDFTFKITRGAGFGLAPTANDVISAMISDWFAVLPATPSQYLDRLLLSNLLSPDLNALEGFTEIDGRFAIVTSQPFITGRNATEIEIRDFMTERKFVSVCQATWFRQLDHLAVFDVGGSNLFATEQGDLVPIDVIPIQADQQLLERLLEALKKKRS